MEVIQYATKQEEKILIHIPIPFLTKSLNADGSMNDPVFAKLKISSLSGCQDVASLDAIASTDREFLLPYTAIHAMHQRVFSSS